MPFDERPEDCGFPSRPTSRAAGLRHTGRSRCRPDQLAMNAFDHRPTGRGGDASGRLDAACDTSGGPPRRRLGRSAEYFRQGHTAGSSAGVVGFHHPVCRIFRGSLNACASLGADLSQVWRNADEFTLTESVINQVGVALGSAPGAGRLNLTEHFLDWFRGIVPSAIGWSMNTSSRR